MTRNSNPRYKLHDQLFHGAEMATVPLHWEHAQALGDRLWTVGYRPHIPLSEGGLSDRSFDRLFDLEAGSVVLAGGIAFTCTKATGHIRWSGDNTFLTAEEIIDRGDVVVLHDSAWNEATNG